jgi:hypothetical protein
MSEGKYHFSYKEKLVSAEELAAGIIVEGFNVLDVIPDPALSVDNRSTFIVRMLRSVPVEEITVEKGVDYEIDSIVAEL